MSLCCRPVPVIGSCVLVVAYVQVAAWLTTSHRQTHRIRMALLSAVLRQEIGWFDTHDSGELGTRLAECVQRRVNYIYLVLLIDQVLCSQADQSRGQNLIEKVLNTCHQMIGMAR